MTTSDRWTPPPIAASSPLYGLELFGEEWVVHETCQVEDGLVADGNTCEKDGHALLLSVGVTGSAVDWGELT